MTSPTGSPFPGWSYLSPIGAGIGAGLLRSVVGTPLDAVATRQVLEYQSVMRILKAMAFVDYWKGFQANTGKFVTRTPVQFGSVKIASSIIPVSTDPAIRGILIGILSSGCETAVNNGWHSLRTRFIQGDNWSVLKKEGPSILGRGLSSAFIHRAMSGALFWGLYEKLKEKHPSYPVLVSTFSGAFQVLSTAPFYITAIYRQRKGATPESLHQTFQHLFKTRGMRGLVLPALGPRLVHSAITTAPLMWLMEQLHLIHRKN